MRPNPAEVVAERLPALMAALEDARGLLVDLADALSDVFCDVAADAGRVGHQTPRHVLRLYGLADEVASIGERLERWSR